MELLNDNITRWTADEDVPSLCDRNKLSDADTEILKKITQSQNFDIGTVT